MSSESSRRAFNVRYRIKGMPKSKTGLVVLFGRNISEVEDRARSELRREWALPIIHFEVEERQS